MATKRTSAKKSSSKSLNPAIDLQPIADALEGIGSHYHFSDLVDRIGDLSYNMGQLARSHALATLAQFGADQDKKWAVEQLKRHVDSN